VAASRAINAHVNDDGRCAVCRSIRFPCPTACLAEANLAVLSEPPSLLPLASRAAQPDSSHRPQRPVSFCGDLAILNRVLAGLIGLDD
jgi:hypothetical protein